jgi:hypothetical protein
VSHFTFGVESGAKFVLEKWLVGDAGPSGFNMRAYGESDSSSGAADTEALNALNAQRTFRYAGKGSHSGGSLTEDES